MMMMMMISPYLLKRWYDSLVENASFPIRLNFVWMLNLMFGLGMLLQICNRRKIT